MHVRDCSCAPTCILRFSMWRQTAPQQTAKFRTAFLVNFLPVWGRIASPIMHGFGLCFRHLLEDWVCFTLRSSVGRWRHKIRKFAAEIFQNVFGAFMHVRDAL